MRKTILTILGAAWSALFLCPISQADSGHLVADVYLPIPSVVAYSSTFSVRADGINWASAQIVVTSVTQSNQAFNDGRAATGSFTVNDYTSLSTAAATGTLTVLSTQSLAGVVASTSVLISSNVTGTIIQITGPPLAGLPPVLTIGGNVAAGFSSTNTAVNVSAFITTNTTSGLMTSTVSGSSVTISFVAAGIFGNAYAITTSSQAAISSGTFVGGVNPATFTFNTGVFQANSQWAVGTSTNATALNIAAALNAGAMGNFITATTGTLSNQVTITADVPGSLANTYGLTSGISSITVSGATLTGGHDNATVCLNGTCLTANAVTSSFTATTSNAQTATSLAGAFNASASSLTVSIGVSGNVVGTTATIVGPAGAYAITTSTQGALTIAPYTSSGTVGASGVAGASGFLTGGTASSYTINASVIQLPTTQNFGLAQGVWFSTTTGNTALTPLVYGTTYYVIPGTNGSGQVQLALTSTGAIAGVPIVLTSSAAKTTSDVFQLNLPLNPAGNMASGTSSVQWMASNDNTHWLAYGTTPFNITIPSVSYSTYFSTGTVTNFDFGHYDYSYIGLSVTASTAAPTNILAHIVGNAP